MDYNTCIIYQNNMIQLLVITCSYVNLYNLKWHGLKILVRTLNFNSIFWSYSVQAQLNIIMLKMHENKLTLILISLTSVLLRLSGFHFCIVNFFSFKILIKIECYIIRNFVMTLLKSFNCVHFLLVMVCVMFIHVSYMSIFFF